MHQTFTHAKECIVGKLSKIIGPQNLTSNGGLPQLSFPSLIE
jgi:hypothetical protein